MTYRPRAMLCEECQKVFLSTRQKQRFCSHSCNMVYRNRVSPPRRGSKKKHPLYRTYQTMIRRCYSPKDPQYGDYGGRGICVCQRWLDNFWAYAADVGVRPEGMVMDRVDNDGPYSPENFQWATYSQSNQNQRPNPRNPNRDEQGRFI